MITGFVTGDERVIANLRQASPRVMLELRKATTTLRIQLAGYIQRNKLSGQSLKNRTGRLWRSITSQSINTDTSTSGIVGTNVEYAHVHEYGFHGTVSVKEHLRMQKVAWGKAMKNPREVTVKAHNMTMNTPGKRFLRDALAENAELIRETYRKAVNRGLQP